MVSFDKISLRNISILFLSFIIGIWSLELFRSYSDPLNSYNFSPIYYLLNRFMIYFATSINNFIILIENYKVDFYFIDIISPFLQFDLSNSYIFDQRYYLLERFSSVEFNSWTYFGKLYANFGIFTPIIIFLFSILIKIVYLNFLSKNFFGLYLFPIFAVCIFDIRIMYLIETRAYFSYLIFFIIYFHSYFNYQKRVVYDS